MSSDDNNAFVLPFVVVLAAALTVMLALLLDQVRFDLDQAMIKSIDERARLTLKLNVPPLVSLIEQALATHPSTFLTVQSIEDNPVYSTCIIDQAGGIIKSLRSTKQDQDSGRIAFTSLDPGLPLLADRVQIAGDSSQSPMEMAWAFEDLSLNAPDQAAEKWWPLPLWQMALSRHATMEDALEIAGLDRLPVVAAADPSVLAYSPDGEPGFVPVLRQARLKFGIFASGNSGQREKVIRIRFYIECSLWNPYNRPMSFHNRAGTEPVFQVVFYNLPMMRILNLSNGMATGWIDIDDLRNSQTGSRGIHAWIRAKAALQPGETSTVIEPDSSYQPEGLARIVHPAFMVSAADRIRIEFKSKDQGISLACLQLEEPDPVSSAVNGNGWVSYGNYHLEFPVQEFERADDPDKPFYLESGSLSFRQLHAQFEISAALQQQQFLDPRMSSVSADAAYPDASNSLISGNEIVEVAIRSGTEVKLEQPGMEAWPALVSWPREKFTNLMQLADVPQWKHAFCIGAEGAGAINPILDKYWPYMPAKATPVESADGRPLLYVQSMHINTIKPDPWLRLLAGQESAAGNASVAILGMYPNPFTEPDYLEISPITLKSVAGRLANHAKSKPVQSVSEFFTSGRLAVLMDDVGRDSLSKLIPLRGLQGKGFQLNAHGDALILHTACFARHNAIEKTLTARVWLLRVPKEDNEVNLEIVRFEWTDPGRHLVWLN